MKQIMVSILGLVFSLISVSSVAVTAIVDKETASQVESNERTLRGTLKSRDQSGKLDTSVGQITLTPAVQVEDQRPIAQWYSNPADAQISLIYQGDRLDRVIIYK